VWRLLVGRNSVHNSFVPIEKYEFFHNQHVVIGSLNAIQLQLKPGQFSHAKALVPAVPKSSLQLLKRL
jgi:hypothetical protein